MTGVDAGTLLAGLRPLQPRLYSLASSRSAVGDEAHLTVAPVRYELHGTAARRRRHHPHRRPAADGRHVAGLRPGESAFPPARRRRPDHHDRPRHRASLRSARSCRSARSAPPPAGPGCSSASATSAATSSTSSNGSSGCKDGVLTRLDVAFSRDTAEKVYVQHRMLRAGPRALRLARGWRAFLRLRRREGDGARRAPDADRRSSSAKAGTRARRRRIMSRALAAEHRYQRDVY